ncbi:MAG: 6-bladed beta-propeller [Pedosphaera sp.]|nr:6-bladed beta-propeller [Pedosphaera sp.]
MNWHLLQNSLLVAGTTTALAVAFGLVAALWLATLETRWRNVFLALAVVALALPPFLVTNCWMDLLGETGTWRSWLPLNIFSLGGSVWVLSLLLWPITTLLVLSGWRRLEAAQLECDPALTGFALVRVLLVPLARGELALGAVVTFVLALNNFAVPAILQTKVLPDEMWIRFNTAFDTLGALKAGLPLVIAPMLLVALFSRREIAWPRLQGSVPARIFRRQLGSAWGWTCGALSLGLCVVSVGLPLADIALANRTWTELPGALAAGQGAVWTSFWLAALTATVIISLALATSAGFFQRRDAEDAEETRRRFLPLRLSASSASLRLGLVWLPFFLPGVLLGIALIFVFNRPPFLGFYRSVGIVVLAFVIRYVALGLTGARHALRSVDSDLTDVARLEGASRWQMLRFVLWPQIAPQILAAGYVVYLLCLWDVESMILVVPPGGETLALRIFNLLHYGHNAQVNALCLALLGLAVLPLAAWSIAKWATKKSSKLQPPSSRETSSSNFQTPLGAWCLALLWMLVLGAWCFCSGCSPQRTKNEAALTSRFFEYAETIGSRGVGIGEFNKPRSVAVDLRDNVYAVDMTGRVQKFSPEGKFLLTWQMPQTDKGKPKGMCLDADGNIIVVEPHYSRVNHFTPDGQLISQWGERGTNAGQLGQPRAAAVNARGEIVVTEFSPTERMQRFAAAVQSPKSKVQSLPLTPALSLSEGERGNPSPSPVQLSAPRLLSVIGQAGTGLGEFNRAEGICVDSHDRIYVADSCNHRIQIFSSDGKFIREYGKAGKGPGELSYPYDICVDAKGNQFVCEFGNSRIQVFDANCQPVEIIGGPGAEPGQFANPWGVALDSHGNLYVADALNHRVQKLVRRAGQMADWGRKEVFSIQCSVFSSARNGTVAALTTEYRRLNTEHFPQ